MIPANTSWGVPPNPASYGLVKVQGTSTLYTSDKMPGILFKAVISEEECRSLKGGVAYFNNALYQGAVEIVAGWGQSMEAIIATGKANNGPSARRNKVLRRVSFKDVPQLTQGVDYMGTSSASTNFEMVIYDNVPVPAVSPTTAAPGFFMAVVNRGTQGMVRHAQGSTYGYIWDPFPMGPAKHTFLKVVEKELAEMPSDLKPFATKAANKMVADGELEFMLTIGIATYWGSTIMGKKAVPESGVCLPLAEVSYTMGSGPYSIDWCNKFDDPWGLPDLRIGRIQDMNADLLASFVTWHRMADGVAIEVDKFTRVGATTEFPGGWEGFLSSYMKLKEKSAAPLKEFETYNPAPRADGTIPGPEGYTGSITKRGVESPLIDLTFAGGWTGNCVKELNRVILRWYDLTETFVKDQ